MLRESIILRFILAIVLLIGTIAGAVRPGECSKNKCGGTCAMHVKTEPVKATEHECCAKTQKKQPVSSKSTTSECKCEFRTVPEGTIGTETGSLSNHVVPVFVLPETIEFPSLASTIEVCSIHFSGDSSPPIVSYHPDFGRAPPSA